MNQEFPSIQDFAPSWADIGVTLQVNQAATLNTSDIAAIKWGDKVDVGEQRGTSGGRVIKQTQGSVANDASITFYMSGWRKLVRGLKVKAPSRGPQKLISLVFFDVVINYTPIGEPDIYTTKLVGLRVLGRSADTKEGNDPDQKEITFKPLQIIEMDGTDEIVLL